MSNFKTAEQMALSHISKEYYHKCKCSGRDAEVWYVSATILYNKKNRYLNRLLGLHKINKKQK